MYEKERTRLNSEKIRILQRLEIIQDRLNEIQAYNDVKAGQMHTAEPLDPTQKKAEG